jgi:hypothetical protein
VELVANLALGLGFCPVLRRLIWLAPAQGNRLSLFFLHSAAAFFLKGTRTGLGWLAAIHRCHHCRQLGPGRGIEALSGIDIGTTDVVSGGPGRGLLFPRAR